MRFNEISRGQSVQFTDRSGRNVTGTVKRINTKSISVTPDDPTRTGQYYRVHPSFLSPVSTNGSTPTPVSRPTRQTPREILASKGVGQADRVDFTFRGRNLTGLILRVNSKSVTIVNIDQPGYRNGVRANPNNIIGKATSVFPTRTPKVTVLPVGTPVTYQGFSWAARGNTNITGVVTRIDTIKDEYEVFGEGRTSIIKTSEATRAAKRDEGTILDSLLSVFSGLSPENLHCDGEASQRQVRFTYARLNRARRALEIEIGRKVDESECWNRARSA